MNSFSLCSAPSATEQRCRIHLLEKNHNFCHWVWWALGQISRSLVKLIFKRICLLVTGFSDWFQFQNFFNFSFTKRNFINKWNYVNCASVIPKRVPACAATPPVFPQQQGKYVCRRCVEKPVSLLLCSHKAFALKFLSIQSEIENPGLIYLIVK